MLGQFAVLVPKENIISDVEIHDDNIQDICLWRQESGLQEFTERFYESKDGEGF